MAQINRDDDKLEFKHIFERIKKVREELGISRIDFSEKVKMSSVSLAQLEAYGVSSTFTILRCLDYLYERANINPLWIIRKDNSKIPKNYPKELTTQELVEKLKIELLRSSD